MKKLLVMSAAAAVLFAASAPAAFAADGDVTDNSSATFSATVPEGTIVLAAAPSITAAGTHDSWAAADANGKQKETFTFTPTVSATANTFSVENETSTSYDYTVSGTSIDGLSINTTIAGDAHTKTATTLTAADVSYEGGALTQTALTYTLTPTAR